MSAWTQKIDGGPSVLYDAVAVLASAEGAALLAAHAPAKDFVNDAHAHCKFVAYVTAAAPLFEAVGLVVSDDDDGGAIVGDDGYVALDGA
jgi:catalase